MENRVEKPWDDSLRNLVRASPQAFVSLVLRNAHVSGQLPHKLKTWKLEVDSLVEVTYEGQKMLVHFEFQTFNDATMAERMLRYNVLIRSEYSLPVLSCVIYLLRDGNVPETPLQWTVPTGQPVLDFYFESIRVGEWSSEELLQRGEPGLLPLLPLTRGGTSRQMTAMMFTSLEAAGQKELMAIGGSLASLMFNRENRADLAWLHRRLREMHNLLRESPYYQEILQEGREEGLKEGLEEGLEKGKLEGLRTSLLAIVQARFPKIVRLAKGQAAIIDDPKELESLAVKVSLAQNAQEARRALLDEAEDDSN
jgi:predicted transposase YdaD